MPQINDIVTNRQNKKFVKKSYRPWDLSGANLSSQVKNNDEKILQDFQIINEVGNNQVNDILEELSVSSKEPIIQEIEHRLNESSVISQQQLDNNKISNEHQINADLDTNYVPIKEQIDNIKITNKDLIDSKIENKSETFREQLDNILNPSSIKNRLQNLSGIQKKLLDLVVDICVAKNVCETGPVQTAIISQYIQTTPGSTKISINRLINKGFIIRKKGKTAKGGYINLQIPIEILTAILDQRKINSNILDPISLILSVKEKINGANLNEQQIDNNLLYSSSNIKNTITTKLPVEWQQIDMEPLAHIGFGTPQLKQLLDKNSPEIIQESIYHFAYALENNDKYKNHPNPLNVIIGVLRKGGSWIEPSYRSKQEIAHENFIKQKQLENERLKKLKEKTLEIAYSEWQENLTEEETNQIIYENSKQGSKKSIIPKQVLLSLYFKEKIWPSIMDKYTLPLS